ncbi:hypothetical protein EHO66_00690 [Leptospira kmetyi]|uniref:hypothetical protein n=1 Tax=Leptospira kmetyi TaxID=408139 RepID=UPI001083D876|nr:hypothetical protein [Leptospira kmetyi]TGK34426.1 hypothetical protein EHO66_00690 [Leptospira kmetyi]
MMNIGYYFGAGISVEAIPAANALPLRMIFLATELQKLKLFEDRDILEGNYGSLEGKPFNEILKLMTDEWIEIGEMSKKLTIDTLANENLRNHSLFNKIKRALSTYFMIEQKKEFPFDSLDYSVKIDSRIRKFISDSANGRTADNFTLLNEPIIFTWNYDFQFELAIANYLKIAKEQHYWIDESQLALNINPKINDYNNSVRDVQHVLYKMNGTAGIFKSSGNGFGSDYFIPKYYFYGDFNLYLKEILRVFSIKRINIDTDYTEINFAFNGNRLIKNETYKIKENASKIERLYVMGYSFPIVNKSIDEEIFSMMTSLKQIHIYDIPTQEILLRERVQLRSKLTEQDIHYYSNLENIPVYG